MNSDCFPAEAESTPTREAAHSDGDPRESLTSLALHTGRGLLMGAADVVPGVSGGTIALLVGIYARLIRAISNVNLELFRLLRARKWRAAARHVDVYFLAALGLGIGLGIVLLGSLVRSLLTESATRPYTLAAFFGMIVGSAALVATRIRPKSTRSLATVLPVGLAGAVFALGVTFLTDRAVVPSLLYLLLCGIIGICAMILPGISGAFLLLVLGVYDHVLEIIHQFKQRNISAQSLLELAVFACGCVLGLLTFSRVLKWLLAHYHAHTMAVLVGFMIGALRKVWPFQIDHTPEVEKLTMKRFEIIWWPESTSLGAAATLVIVAAAAAVLLADWAARRPPGLAAPAPKSHAPAAGRRGG